MLDSYEPNLAMYILRQDVRSLRELAELTGLSKSSFARWREGNGVPDDESRRVISDVLRIRPSDWDHALPMDTELPEIPRSAGGRPRKDGAR